MGWLGGALWARAIDGIEGEREAPAASDLAGEAFDGLAGEAFDGGALLGDTRAPVDDPLDRVLGPGARFEPLGARLAAIARLLAGLGAWLDKRGAWLTGPEDLVPGFLDGLFSAIDLLCASGLRDGRDADACFRADPADDSTATCGARDALFARGTVEREVTAGARGEIETGARDGRTGARAERFRSSAWLPVGRGGDDDARARPGAGVVFACSDAASTSSFSVRVLKAWGGSKSSARLGRRGRSETGLDPKLGASSSAKLSVA